MTDTLAAAAAAGYPTITSPSAPDPVAARLLAHDHDAVGVAIAGDVLLAAVAEVPSPSRVAALEEASGMAVTIAVAPRDVVEHMRAAASRIPGGGDQITAGLLQEARAQGASDILLTVGRRPAVRVAGQYRRLDTFPCLAADDVIACARWLTGHTGPGTRTATTGPDRWRATMATSCGHPTLAVRRLPAAVPRAEDISAPAALLAACDARAGLVVVASPPAGGKSTTVAALVNRVAASRSAHILVVNDVPEYVQREQRAVVTCVQPGLDGPSTAEAVLAADRLGADVVAIEVRTGADARAALLAASAGQLVIIAVAGNSAPVSLARLVALLDPQDRQWAWATVAATLRAACAQELLPTTSGAQGAVFEVLVPTPAQRAAVAAGDVASLAVTLEDAHGDGATSMTRALARNVAAGRLHLGTARSAAPDTVLFDQWVAAAPAAPASVPAPAAGASNPARSSAAAAHAPQSRTSPQPPPAEQPPAMPTRASLRGRG